MKDILLSVFDDAQIGAAIDAELNRQQTQIELIASPTTSLGWRWSAKASC
ncbi:hypothetical protein [Tabrizicola sp.]|nr:hypothetical protein [Tabrizicola sp.]MBY0352567.1 hypothetical protein [Tabrizicola sp.]